MLVMKFGGTSVGSTSVGSAEHLRGVVRLVSPPVLAHLSSLGGRASCALLSGLFRSSGWPVVDLDAREVIVCTGNPLETTEHYRPRPLVVQGYGAGPEVTAAGPLADILKITTRGAQ